MKADYRIAATDKTNGRKMVLSCYDNPPICDEEVHVGSGIWIPVDRPTIPGAIVFGLIIVFVFTLWLFSETSVPKPKEILD